MTQSTPNSDWKFFRGTREPNGDRPPQLPPPPPWRQFQYDDEGDEGDYEGGDEGDDKWIAERQRLKGQTFQVNEEAIEMVNAALYLRRPLLITGNPGTGKSSLAYAVAYELNLGTVLKWAITTRTTLKDGLYSYDAIARLQDAQLSGKDNPEQMGDYITLGALGTAFLPSKSPRVLLIDEIDKSDIDLPNDLLNLFEDGEFAIPELQRLKISPVTVRTADRTKEIHKTASVRNGLVRCRQFPLVIMTSNNERDFPPPFLRRCLRYDMPTPKTPEALGQIVAAHLGEAARAQSEDLIVRFLRESGKGVLAVDQLLNVIHLLTQDRPPSEKEQERLKAALLKALGSNEGG
ncbi:MAG: MoxR family ATPase [Oculatellaceae cyanobacterium Prado106]|jgi:MoxR-like ATPase|nr:MoxR family ATPase [Oculatellaceae cyanobacterium Prado106]